MTRDCGLLLDGYNCTLQKNKNALHYTALASQRIAALCISELKRLRLSQALPLSAESDGDIFKMSISLCFFR